MKYSHIHYCFMVYKWLYCTLCKYVPYSPSDPDSIGVHICFDVYNKATDDIMVCEHVHTNIHNNWLTRIEASAKELLTILLKYCG